MRIITFIVPLVAGTGHGLRVQPSADRWQRGPLTKESSESLVHDASPGLNCSGRCNPLKSLSMFLFSLTPAAAFNPWSLGTRYAATDLHLHHPRATPLHLSRGLSHLASSTYRYATGLLYDQRHSDMSMSDPESASAVQESQDEPLDRFDVIVIGGGHAGCEAAAAAARRGASTVLVTQRQDTIGEMSCNPSIGGIGKGHLVREVDALDGLMGRVIDQAGIHFRILNRKKGAAVQGPRAQADRDLYRKEMLEAVLSTDNLRVHEASAEDLIVEHDIDGKARVAGIITKTGDRLLAPRVILTTGTFMRGVVHIGQTSRPAGRYIRDSDKVEAPCTALSKTLADLELPLGRLKTGTPPRLNGDTIDWESLQEHAQPSEDPPEPISYLNECGSVAQKDNLITCYHTKTNLRTHEIVRAHAHELPEFDSGGGKGVGVRYCPSLYTKVERFGDREGHLIWLEPEGLSTKTVYPNGIASAFPVDVQQELINSIRGLEKAEIIQPAYDVEYDFVDARSLSHTLEVKNCTGLYLAGQIIGTTGYEEAAALGLVAGANAAISLKDQEQLVIGRDQGYIGVLVDDLVTRGTMEPYRMFTSRAEHRLLLRADNADTRLTELGYNAGIVGEERYQLLQRKKKAIEEGLSSLRRFRLENREWAERGFKVSKSVERRSAYTLLQNSNIEMILSAMAELPHGWREGGVPDEPQLPELGRRSLEVLVQYEAYIKKGEIEVRRIREAGQWSIPEDFDYSSLASLSAEEVEKLSKARPATIEEAGAISGVTPSGLMSLYQVINSLKKKEHAEKKRQENQERQDRRLEQQPSMAP